MSPLINSAQYLQLSDRPQRPRCTRGSTFRHPADTDQGEIASKEAQHDINDEGARAVGEGGECRLLRDGWRVKIWRNEFRQVLLFTSRSPKVLIAPILSPGVSIPSLCLPNQILHRTVRRIAMREQQTMWHLSPTVLPPYTCLIFSILRPTVPYAFFFPASFISFDIFFFSRVHFRVPFILVCLLTHTTLLTFTCRTPHLTLGILFLGLRQSSIYLGYFRGSHLLLALAPKHTCHFSHLRTKGAGLSSAAYLKLRGISPTPMILKVLPRLTVTTTKRTSYQKAAVVHHHSWLIPRRKESVETTYSSRRQSFPFPSSLLSLLIRRMFTHGAGKRQSNRAQFLHRHALSSQPLPTSPHLNLFRSTCKIPRKYWNGSATPNCSPRASLTQSPPMVTRKTSTSSL